MFKMLKKSKDAKWLADTKVIFETGDSMNINRCVLSVLSEKWAKQIEWVCKERHTEITIHINIPRGTFEQIIGLWYDEYNLDAETALNLAFAMDMEACSENITSSVFEYLESNLSTDLCCFVCLNYDIIPDALKDLICTFLLGHFDEIGVDTLIRFTPEWKQIIFTERAHIRTQNSEITEQKLSSIEKAIRSELALTYEWKDGKIQWGLMEKLKPHSVKVIIPGPYAIHKSTQSYTPGRYKKPSGFAKPKSFWKIRDHDENSFIAIEDTHTTVFLCAFADGGVSQFKTFERKISDILVQPGVICLLFEDGRVDVFESSTDFLTNAKQTIDIGSGKNSLKLTGCGGNRFLVSVDKRLCYYARESTASEYSLKVEVETSGMEVKAVCSSEKLAVSYHMNDPEDYNKSTIDLYTIGDTLQYINKMEFIRTNYSSDICIHGDKVFITGSSTFIQIWNTTTGKIEKINAGNICTEMTLCASSIFLRVREKDEFRYTTVPWIFDINENDIIKKFTYDILLADSVNYLNGRVLIAYNQEFELI
jgi:hypothetical protein